MRRSPWQWMLAGGVLAVALVGCDRLPWAPSEQSQDWPLDKPVSVALKEQDSVDGIMTAPEDAQVTLSVESLRICKARANPADCLLIRGRLRTPTEFIGTWEAAGDPVNNTEFQCSVAAQEIDCEEKRTEEDGSAATTRYWLARK
ncbi:hypothetical protein [Synechococcus elongatus]|uniref:Uncharacterized protein n=1 Tax=Synechococcus elongatus PCC 11801 TaxID=2219813 RepID=A0AAN1QQC2_SYNEL|nr:hypothetical protein [Synechococcus elongatus]AZB73411.1 hypothetical protein DOP62_12455 [Synechococcus elongatus PCC 11801]